VRTPADLVGKKVGIQPTAAVLLRALLAKNKIAEKDVNIIPIGADMTPLMTGQVDVVTGWLTNTTALKVLGKDRIDMTLWDAGVKLYALPYYANTKTLQSQPHALEAFLRATSRGWHYAQANRDQAVDHLVKEYPNLNREDERVALDTMLQYSFGDLTKTQGWGAMDPAVWQDQINLYSQLGPVHGRRAEAERRDHHGHPEGHAGRAPEGLRPCNARSAWPWRRPSARAASASASSRSGAASPRCKAWTSRSRPANSSPCSARPAAASRPSCASSPT
jgi:hypothetical protein